jgi:CheY-like chemotaxis protein
MDGDIAARSQVGLGTTFSITLPLLSDPTPRVVERDGYLTGGARVLCVDDHPRQRRHLATAVGALGLRWATAPDAIAAFDQLRDAARQGDRFAAVLVDRRMPGVGGAEFVRLVRAEPLLEGLGVVVLTPMGDSGAGRELAGLVVADAIVKPVRRAALVEALGKVLGWTDPRAAREAGGASTRAQVATGGRVLVAEDNAVNQRVILAQLRRLGLEAVLARNGQEAVAAVAAGHFDVVLMDCQMPELDGFEATRAIRALPGAAARVPIVALTASALTSDRDRCFEAGMNAFLAKPVDHARLAEALGRWLPAATAA